MPVLKAGDKAPRLTVNEDKLALLGAARVTVMVYVLVVEPSCAVTIVVMALAPMLKVIAPEGLPEVTVVLFTVTVAVGSAVVGVTITEVMAFPTASV